MMDSKRNYTVIVILALIWSFHFFVLGFLNQKIDPLATGAFVRFVTFLILTASLFAQKRLHILYPFPTAVVLKLICVGILGFLLDWTSFIGFQYSSANTGTVLLKTDVIFANVLSVIFFKEHLTKSSVLLTCSMLLGVLMVLGINPFDLQFHAFDLFFILSALFVTLNAFLIQHLQHAHKVSNAVIAYYNNFVTFLLFTIAMLVSNRMPSLSTLTGSTLLMIVSCGITQAAIYLFYYAALSRFPVWIVKNILLLIPVFTMVYSLVFLHVVPSLLHLSGAAIVLLSASLMIRSHNKPEK